LLCLTSSTPTPLTYWQDPSLWPAAVDEICRYHTASSYALRRVALEDVKMRDVTIK
jgi:cytochrome P450